MTYPLTNWAGNVAFAAREILHPTSVDAVRAAVREHTQIKVLGTGHSFNGIADGAQAMLVLDALAMPIELDPASATVRAPAGITFGALGAFLDERGWALPNLASLPHISLAGAYATGTHGSGDGNPVLADAVVALELVDANGELVHLSRADHPDVFDGVVVGLGALGVVVSVTVAVVPAFAVHQHVYLDLAFDTAMDHFDTIMATAYSVSLFSNWQKPVFDMVWCKSRGADPERHDPRTALHGARPATTDQHPIPGLDAIHCTEQRSRPGPAHRRLPHFRMDFVPSHGDELQTEYLLPRQHAVAAFNALRPLQPELTRLTLVNEVRTIARDTLWMSPAYGRDSVAFHFTFRPDASAVQGLLARIEAALAPFEPRAHWGKVFAMTPADVQRHYPRLADFRHVVRRFDPGGKFRNGFLATHVLG